MDDDITARSLVSINPDTLQREFVTVVAHLSRANQVYADRLKDFLIADHKFDVMVARLRLEWRTRLEDAKIMLAERAEKDEKAAKASKERVTDTQVESKVLDDERYERAKLSQIDAKVEQIRARGVCEALVTKRAALIALGSNIRAEGFGDPSVKMARLQDEMDRQRGGVEIGYAAGGDEKDI